MSGSHLPAPARLSVPVRGVLDDVLDEAALQRAYAGVRARRAARERAPNRRWVYALAAAVALVAIALVVLLRPRDAGPIALANGAAFVAMDAPAPTQLALDDGSVISLDPGAKLTPLENGGERVVVLLERGRARFEVKPGGPRRWLVECGAATVEVVGTGFTIDRGEAMLRVQVAHGVVLVRGEAVPDRVRRLDAGDAIEIPIDRAPRASMSAPRGAIEPAPAPSAPAPSASASAHASAGAPASGAPWRDLAARGKYADAYELLGGSGIRERAASASPDELFLLADVARLSGHAGDAIAPLERIVREHPSDSRAALAAFTLGKLYGASAAGAAMFERAIQLGLPGSLQGDARARWAEACKKIGDAACEARASGK